jgi:UDP-N-acetylglucosamine:LPS N-acetylglucosamine transferase
MALVNEQAALLVKDQAAHVELGPSLLQLSGDTALCQTLRSHILKMGHRNASQRIAEAVIEIIDTTSQKN